MALSANENAQQRLDWGLPRSSKNVYVLIDLAEEPVSATKEFGVDPPP
jgi:hypothetical protein